MSMYSSKTKAYSHLIPEILLNSYLKLVRMICSEYYVSGSVSRNISGIKCDKLLFFMYQLLNLMLPLNKPKVHGLQ